MRKILLFLASFLLLVGWLLFYPKKTQAYIWSGDDCQSCTNTNCCGSWCDTSQYYFCNNIGYGICFCDQKTRWQPPTSTPGPRPPGPTQPGGGGGGGGGPTPTEKYAHRQPSTSGLVLRGPSDYSQPPTGALPIGPDSRAARWSLRAQRSSGALADAPSGRGLGGGLAAWRCIVGQRGS